MVCSRPLTFSVTGHNRQNTINNPETLEEELKLFNLINVSVPKYSLSSISINLGRCPSKLQMSTIVPVFKCNDGPRSISWLSNFNSILERLMCGRMMNCVKEYNLLYYTFPSAAIAQEIYSTCQISHVDAIHWETNMNQELFFCGVFIRLIQIFWHRWPHHNARQT